MLRTMVLVAALAIGISLGSGMSPDAQAAEIKVLSAAVMKPVFAEVAEQFRQATGHRLTINYVPAGAARARAGAGEAFDVVIVQRPAAEELARERKIDPRSM